MPRTKVVKVTGPVILEWPNGMRIHVAPEGSVAAGRPAVKARGAAKANGRPGRKPSPATQAVIDAMESDHAAGKQRSRQGYLDVLREAGYDGSDAGASQILAREATRVLGQSLGRASKKATRKGTTKGKAARGPGRQPSKATASVREKIQKDAAAGQLRDATHYVRWLVHRKDIAIGLKAARPIVYRELRSAR